VTVRYHLLQQVVAELFVQSLGLKE